jgi:hypothetical protein
VKGLFRAWRAKFFGFAHANGEVTLLDEDELRCIYGFEEVNIPYHGYHDLPVDVVFVPMAGQPNVPADATLLDVKRFGVWGHSERNRRIASLASRLAIGNVEGLAQRFPTVGRAVRSDGPQRVSILVENREHAAALAQMLCDWIVVAGPGPGMPRQSSAFQKLLEKRCPQLLQPNRQIFTASEAKHIDLGQVDVLISADAGTGPPIPNWVFENPISHRLLLVDFADRHHPVLRRRSRKRREAYAARGWFAPGADPVEERVKLFLASRPKVT